MKKYCLIGEKLSHSMSPFIHKKLLEFSGIYGEYSLLEIPKEDFIKTAKTLKSSYNGFNITIPYKVDILPFIDAFDKSAAIYNSVNCITIEHGVALGYNTDVNGFLNSLKAKNIPLTGKVLLLGAGGTGRMMATETILAGGELTIAIRESSTEKATKLKKELLEKNPNAIINIVDIDIVEGGFDTVLNSTPVGMYPKAEFCPLKDDVIKNCDNFFDAIYNPVETVLIKKALSYGKNAVGGMSMLVNQAVVAHEIWNNSMFMEEEIQAVIKEAQEIVTEKYK